MAAAGEVAAFEVHHGQMLWHQPFKGEGASTVGLAVQWQASQGDVIR